MSVTVYNEQEWFDYLLAAYRALPQFAIADLSDLGFLGLLARVTGQAGALISQGIKDADNDSVPAYDVDADGNIRSRCSSIALDAWAFTFGLPSGVAGRYGRRGPTISTGGVGTPTGTAGTLIPAGTQAVDSTGQITVQTTAAVTLNGPPNTLPVSVNSITTGAQANLPILSLLTWVSPPAGLDPTFSLTSALAGALDVESDTQVLARLLQRIQNPPRGGTAADYRAWAEESVDLVTNAQLGVARAYVYPLRSGLGTVDVVPLQAGAGAARVPGAAILLKVLAYLNFKRPVTAYVNVIAPSTLPADALRIRVRIIPNPTKGGTYLFDWGGVNPPPVTITAFNATNKTITITAVPASLLTAFTNNLKPRVQMVVSTAGASALPFQARVIGIGGTTLTLDAFPPVNPTNGTDYIFPGGGAVDLVAARILALVDALGPSRQSGFADPYDNWTSDVSLAGVIDTVMDTRDTDGTNVVLDIPSVPINGVQIAVGSGAFAAVSYTPQDTGASLQLAFLRSGGIDILQG